MKIKDLKGFTIDKNMSKGDENCKNILIKGDNKQVLPELEQVFNGKIKCVYIDPPYNNGDSYHYYNDKTPSSTWLKNLKIVLSWLRVLLTKDGSVWISIDDNEMAYLKIEADKVFGRENFAGTIVWQQRKTRENRSIFSCNHEYILVYARNIKEFKKSRNLLPVDDDFVVNKYKNPDSDPRGPWQSVSASVQAGHAVPSQFYTITSPSGLEFNPPKGRCWVYNQKRMLREIEQNNIWFGLDGNNTPRIKKFLSNAKIGLTPETLWAGDSCGTTDSAKKHLLSLFPDVDNIFDTPKPEQLIKQIIEIASNEGDYVLDCYVGSGTTLATAHKLNRNYIGIEIGDQMVDLVVRRMNSVVNGETGGISSSINWHGGGQFVLFNYVKNRLKKSEDTESSEQLRPQMYRQLNLFELYEHYGENSIIENVYANEPITNYVSFYDDQKFLKKNVLICNVKKDNWDQFLSQKALIYYTGKKFPSTVDLKKLYYFIPYIQKRGIRDLYIIKVARLGFRKEGQHDEDKNDIRLVFEIKFIRQLFPEYSPVNLNIWRTFRDTTLEQLCKDENLPI